MKELEELRQVMIKTHFKTRKKEMIIVTITLIILSILYSLGLGYYLWKYEHITNLFEFNGIGDLFDVTKIYIHTLTPIVFSAILLFFLYRDRHYRVKDYYQYRKQYKELIYKKVLSDIFQEVELFPRQGLPRSKVKNSMIVEMGESFYSTDYHKGIYKGVSFEGSDVTTQHEVDLEHTSAYVNDFFGQVYIFEFNKRFSGTLIVTENNILYNKKPKDYLEMEDQEFNRSFTVSTNDKHLAYYILTPTFMNKLKAIKKEVEGKISFSFIDNKLNIAIYNNKDIFECDPFNDIDEEIAKTSKEISVITQIIDTLDLDNDIFK